MTQEYLMNTYRRLPITFSSGLGNKLWDKSGVEYLDAISGIAVTSLGHSNHEIKDIVSHQAGKLMHSSNLFQVEWQSILGQKICEISGMDKAFICNSGCESNEAALKLARIYGRSRGVVSPVVIVMESAFHGRTFATGAASHNPSLNIGFEFEPLINGFIRAPFGNIQVLHQLASKHIDIVAVFIEPIQGEGGVRIASSEYMRQLREVCNRYSWLLILDEIQSGLGRTGEWFAFQHSAVKPDIVTLAKALGNGFPIGACAAQGIAAFLFEQGDHGTTFGGNPLGCRVACEVINIIHRDRLVSSAKRIGQIMLEIFEDRLSKFSEIVSIRGKGLMIAIELAMPCSELVELALKRERLLINVTRSNTLRLLPSLITSTNEAVDIAERVSRLVRSWIELKGE